MIYIYKPSNHWQTRTWFNPNIFLHFLRIMGDGKTTVIAPLLALILADGHSLVCCCMPNALLEMSRAVLARCFSSPVAPKAVITFKFGRSSHADQGLYDKLEAHEKFWGKNMKKRMCHIVSTAGVVKSTCSDSVCNYTNVINPKLESN